MSTGSTGPRLIYDEIPVSPVMERRDRLAEKRPILANNPGSRGFHVMVVFYRGRGKKRSLSVTKGEKEEDRREKARGECFYRRHCCYPDAWIGGAEEEDSINSHVVARGRNCIRRSRVNENSLRIVLSIYVSFRLTTRRGFCCHRHRLQHVMCN